MDSQPCDTTAASVCMLHGHLAVSAHDLCTTALRAVNALHGLAAQSAAHTSVFMLVVLAVLVLVLVLLPPPLPPLLLAAPSPMTSRIDFAPSV